MNDMVEIIKGLNKIVLQAIADYKIKKVNWMALATGDGMCLCLFRSTPETQVHLAFDIRRSVNEWNLKQTREARRFMLRTALHVYDDFRIKDINGRQNIIGHGINTVARTMNLGEPGEILVTNDLYASVKKDEMFMNTFSSPDRKKVKDEWYGFRRIELLEELRNWTRDAPEIAKPLTLPDEKVDSQVEDSNTHLDTLRELMALGDSYNNRPRLTPDIGISLPSIELNDRPDKLFANPKPLINETVDLSQIDDNRLQYAVITGGFWHPAAKPKTGPMRELPTYSQEFPLKESFRSFSALVTPNGEFFRLALKLMNEAGTLEAHKAFGEFTFVLSNDLLTTGMKLGKLDAGVSYERLERLSYAPRFEIEFKVLPLRGSKLQVARIYVDEKEIHTCLIPKEFTKRFGIVASGNSKPCHMTLSEIEVYTAAK